MKTKAQIIQQITSLIDPQFGVNSNDLGFENQQVYKMISKDHCVLIDCYSAAGFGGTEYVHETEVKEVFGKYEELTKSQLLEILTALVSYAN